MIDRLAALQFRGLRDVSVRLDNLTLLVGPNGGGKSNLLDALRFLQGVGNGFTVGEILDGKPEGAANRKWDGIRGRAAEALWQGARPADDAAWEPGLPRQSFALYAGLGAEDDDGYSIAVDPERRCVTGEAMVYRGKGYSTTGRGSDNVLEAALRRGSRGRPLTQTYGSSVPLLTQLSRAGAPTALAASCREIAQQLADVRFLDLDVRCLREATPPHYDTLGEHGENFAAVATALAGEDVLQPWLSEFLADPVRDIRPFRTELGDVMFGVVEHNGAHISARSLSDGTLRFVALATALFSPTRSGLLLIEEIENGLHPSRLRLVVEMLVAASERGQIVVTTHSPAVLAFWPQERHVDVLVATQGEAGAGAVVLPLTKMPGYAEALAERRLDQLQIEGWTAARV